MLRFIIPLLIVSVCGIVLGLGYKYASVTRSRVGAFGSILMVIGFLMSLGYSFFEPSAWSDIRLWGIGIAMGLVLVSAFGLLVRANQIGCVSTSWVVVNLSSVLAIVLAVLFLPNENFLRVDIFIVTVFIAMILALHAGMKGAGEGKETKAAIHPLFWPFMFLTFFLNGFFLFLMKIKEGMFPAGNSSGATIAICFGTAGVLMTLYHVIACCRRREVLWQRHDIIAGVTAGVAVGLGNTFILQCMSLPAVVVYPIAQGVPMIGGVIAMALLYKERFNRAKAISLFLAIAVLLLTMLRTYVARNPP